MTEAQGANSLSKWLDQSNAEEFPSAARKAYLKNLRDVKTRLDDHVYGEVDTGALATEGVMLTRHGSRHVDTVVRRARDLVMDESNVCHGFTPYEVYLLLMAIYIHDIGNLKGRDQHEKNIASMVEQLEIPLSDETVERKAIIEIAQAHGGTINGTNRDTLGQLAKTDTVMGQCVRKQALAAVLRFADELADDSTRSRRLLKKLGRLPKQSQIYHHYADALHSVNVRRSQHAVDLHFLFRSKEAVDKYCKDNRSVYLLDEIYQRTLKMYRECEYCMRFTNGLVWIDTISVRIEIHSDKYGLVPAVHPIGYRLSPSGYPDDSDEDIHQRIPGLMTGSVLADKIQEGEACRDT